MFHMGQQERVYVFDRYYIVDIAFFDPERSFCVGYFGGTGRDKDNADLLRLQLGLLHRLRPRDLRRRLHRRFDGQETGDKCGKFHPDQPDHGRTGGADKGRFVHMLLDI